MSNCCNADINLVSVVSISYSVIELAETFVYHKPKKTTTADLTGLLKSILFTQPQGGALYNLHSITVNRISSVLNFQGCYKSSYRVMRRQAAREDEETCLLHMLFFSARLVLGSGYILSH